MSLDSNYWNIEDPFVFWFTKSVEGLPEMIPSNHASAKTAKSVIGKVCRNDEEHMPDILRNFAKAGLRAALAGDREAVMAIYDAIAIIKADRLLFDGLSND